MSPPGCQKMWVKPCNRNAEESFPVLSLKSREQKPPNHLLIQDKDVLQPRWRLADSRLATDKKTRRLPCGTEPLASSSSAPSVCSRHRWQRQRRSQGRSIGWGISRSAPV